MDEQEKLSLTNILGGAAVEMFDRCLNDEVLPNIADINTTLKQREIKLTIAFLPADENRNLLAFAIKCESKLCGQEPVKAYADIQLDSKGRVVAVERVTNQRELPFNNVTSIEKKGG